jgi:hypothetical protein
LHTGGANPRDQIRALEAGTPFALYVVQMTFLILCPYDEQRRQLLQTFLCELFSTEFFLFCYRVTNTAGVDVVVGTPGRVEDFLSSGKLDVSCVRVATVCLL